MNEGLKLQITADVNDAVQGLNQTAQAVAALKLEQRLLSGEMATVTAALKTNASELNKNIAVEQTAIKNKMVHGQAYKDLKNQILINQQEEKRLTDILAAKSTQLEVSKAELKGYQTEMNNASAGANKLGRAVTNLTDANSLAAGGVMRLRRMLIGSVFTAAAFAITEALIPAIKSMMEHMDKASKMNKTYSEALDGSKDSASNARIEIENLKRAVDLSKKSVIDKKEVVDLYNDTIGKTTGMIKKEAEAEDFLKNKTQDYIKFMMLRAAANYALEQASKAATQAEIDRLKPVDQFSSAGTRAKAFAQGQSSAPGFVPGMASGPMDIHSRNLDQARIEKNETVRIDKEKADLQLQVYENFLKEMDAIKEKWDPFGKKEKKGDTGDSDKANKEAFEIAKKDLENKYKSEQDMAYQSNTMTAEKGLEIELNYLLEKVELYKKFGQMIYDVQVEYDKKYEELKNHNKFSLNNTPDQQDVKKDGPRNPAIGQYLKDLLFANDLEKSNNTLLADKADFIKGTLGPAFNTFFTDIADGNKTVFQSLGSMLGNLLKQIAETLLEALALAAIMTLITPGASFAGKGAGTFSNFLGGFLGGATHKHAAGGIIPSAMQFGNHVMGEQGAEALIPLNRLGEFASSMGTGLGGGSVTNMSGVLRGEDIVFAYERAQQRRGKMY